MKPAAADTGPTVTSSVAVYAEPAHERSGVRAGPPQTARGPDDSTAPQQRRPPDLVLVLRYRKAVTYGFHVLLGALGEHETATRYEVRFGETPEATAEHIRAGVDGGVRVLVLWSFYSPDAAAMADELKVIRALADGPGVTHVAGGVHATAEPVQTLDAGWDVAAIGRQRPLDDFPGFALKWGKFNALEVTRGCIYACP